MVEVDQAVTYADCAALEQTVEVINTKGIGWLCCWLAGRDTTAFISIHSFIQLSWLMGLRVGDKPYFHRYGLSVGGGCVL